MDLAYLSLHAVLHEDKNGELVDITYYCSDRCAREDSDYRGWFGCMEVELAVEHGPWTCPGCGKTIELE